VKFLHRSLPFGLLVGALSFLLPKSGHAGPVYPPPAPFCVRYSGGTGWCQGTMPGFRADPDAQTWASVTTSTMGNSLYFSADYHGTYVSCLVPWNNDHLAGQITRLATWQGPFTVYFDQYGYCTDIAIYQASYYQP